VELPLLSSKGQQHIKQSVDSSRDEIKCPWRRPLS
jgi:hypothetical protein